jgi:hypothetical protein
VLFPGSAPFISFFLSLSGLSLVFFRFFLLDLFLFFLVYGAACEVYWNTAVLRVQ